MKKNPLISVVIPTHNRANLLSRAIDSAMNQTYDNFEIIVVSDGSTDDTDLVMQRYNNVVNLQYIKHDKPFGGNHARNTGIRTASGVIIAFLDDDDVWYKNKLAKQYEIFKSDDMIGLVATGINAIYEGEDFSTVYIPPTDYDSSEKILISNCIGSTTTVAVKKDILFSAGLFDENLKAQQDYDLWIRVCQLTKCGVVREPCVDYYNYPSANQISMYTEKYKEAVDYIENKYAALFSKLSISSQKRRKALQELEIAKKAIRNNSAQEARRYSINSLRIIYNHEAITCWIASFFKPTTIRRIRGVLRRIKYDMQPKH